MTLEIQGYQETFPPGINEAVQEISDPFSDVLRVSSKLNSVPERVREILQTPNVSLRRLGP